MEWGRAGVKAFWGRGLGLEFGGRWRVVGAVGWQNAQLAMVGAAREGPVRWTVVAIAGQNMARGWDECHVERGSYMRAGSLQRWWGLAALGGALASLSGGLTGPDVDSIAYAHESKGLGVPVASRLVFREAPVGATHTAQRWDADERVAIAGWSDEEDGGAGVRLTAMAGGTAQAEARRDAGLFDPQPGADRSAGRWGDGGQPGRV